jgi:hypothetical protein
VFSEKYALTYPAWDGWWEEATVLARERPFDAHYLWEQNGDHRFPMGKLIDILLLKVTGSDFRAVPLANIAMLAALAFGLIHAAKQVRGASSYADAFFPLLLLHWAHTEAFIWSWVIIYVIPTLLTGLLFLIIVQHPERLTLGATLAAGLCLLLLPLNGASGCAVVPALALWLGYAGIRHRSSSDPHDRQRGLLMLGFALTAAALLGAYYLDYRRDPQWIAPNPSPWQMFKAFIMLLSLSLGVAGTFFWKPFGLGVAALSLMSIALVLVVAWTRPRERFRAAGLLLFTAATGCLLLGLSWARGSAIAEDVSGGSRWIMMLVPILYYLYFVLGMCTSRAIGSSVQMGLCILAFASFLPNSRHGLQVATYRRGIQERFERDLLAGMPPFLLVDRYGDELVFGGPSEEYDFGSEADRKKEIARVLGVAQQAGIGALPYLREDPELREIPVPVVAKRAGPNTEMGSLSFRLPQLQSVYAVRLKHSFTHVKADRVDLRMSWQSAVSGFPKMWRHFDWQLRRYRDWDVHPQPEQKTVLVWVNDTIDQFHIEVENNQCEIQVAEISLLVPATDPSRQL